MTCCKRFNEVDVSIFTRGYMMMQYLLLMPFSCIAWLYIMTDNTINVAELYSLVFWYSPILYSSSWQCIRTHHAHSFIRSLLPFLLFFYQHSPLYPSNFYPPPPTYSLRPNLLSSTSALPLSLSIFIFPLSSIRLKSRC